MARDLSTQILDYLGKQPGQTAKRIAAALGVDKKSVNSKLYGKLRGRVHQDSSYRWWSQKLARQSAAAERTSEVLDTDLSRLCRYYLDCISHDDQGGVSVFASSRHNLDYCEIDSLPGVGDTNTDPFASSKVRDLLSRLRRDKARLKLVLGYPTRLKKFRSRKGHDFFKVEPVLLYSMDQSSESSYSSILLSAETPAVNASFLEGLLGRSSRIQLEELVALSAELGMDGSIDEFPDLEDLIPRLRQIRSDWDWKEEPIPESLSSGIPLSKLAEQGIYNRAIVVLAERSPFTKGLETELTDLQKVPPSEYEKTALGSWLSGRQLESEPTRNHPLLEVLPLNTEQRQAVYQGLANPLTVITGPPGTGKSQVVTSLVINAAWMGQSVVFTSKNNKAVDVVETRVNDLGPRPLLLRLGAREYQDRLADHLTNLLSVAELPGDRNLFLSLQEEHSRIRDRFVQLEEDLKHLVDVRNQVDSAEQAVEKHRQSVGENLFRSFRELDCERLDRIVSTLVGRVVRASKAEQAAMSKLFWFALKNWRHADLLEVAREAYQDLVKLGIPLPKDPPSDQHIAEWNTYSKQTQKRLKLASEVNRYFRHLAELSSLEQPEAIAAEHSELVDELSKNSESLLACWLRRLPGTLVEADRKTLGDFLSVLKLLTAANQTKTKPASKVWARYFQLARQVTKVLSCWAVTSLSAKGRVPLQGNFCDLLIVDEASQCDIASVVPLLFRARRAVIIGDPMQLRHISKLGAHQDQQLLEKHDLLDSFPSWAYAVNSLFDLASRLCRPEDLVNLRDHHRSHSEIIEFSNQVFYEGRLRVATRYDRLKPLAKGEPAVRWIEVSGDVKRPSSGGAVNQIEAETVVRELERIVVRQGYEGTVGVVSPFRAQANRVRDLVHSNDELSRRLSNSEFLADTVHRFQGDERDLMVFSPVVSDSTPKGALYFLQRNPNLFNVAITRARSTLVVVGDRKACGHCEVDYLRKFAKFSDKAEQLRKPKSAESVSFGPEYPTVARPELVSDWERAFYMALYAAGLRPIPQYDVDKYTLDFALLDGDRRLDIEVDGERYHRNWDGELCWHDQLRNQRLIELGWDVMRFWVYQIRDDLGLCIERINIWRGK